MQDDQHVSINDTEKFKFIKTRIIITSQGNSLNKWQRFALNVFLRHLNKEKATNNLSQALTDKAEEALRDNSYVCPVW